MTNNIIQVALALALLVNVATGVAAQSPDSLLRKASKAMGGERALRSITARAAKGAITRASDGAQGAFQMLTLKPDLYLLTFEIGGLEVSEGFNGKSAWRRDSRAGLRTLTGDESLALRATANYRGHHWLNYKKDKSKLADAGQETVGGKPAHAVVLATKDNVKIKLWFDAASGLLVKEEMPAGNGVMTFEYSDHRAVDGVMEPFTIRLLAGDEQYRGAAGSCADARRTAPSIRLDHRGLRQGKPRRGVDGHRSCERTRERGVGLP